MKIELTQAFPIPLKKGFDYLDDFRTWPDWYNGMIEIIEPALAKWIAPGDEVRWTYRLLGRKLEGKAVLDSRVEGEFAVFTTKVEGLPEIHWEYRYAEAGPEAFVLKVVMETEEATSFFGKVIDRTLLPKMIERDLRTSLENLDHIFAMSLFA